MAAGVSTIGDQGEGERDNWRSGAKGEITPRRAAAPDGQGS